MFTSRHSDKLVLFPTCLFVCVLRYGKRPENEPATFWSWSDAVVSLLHQSTTLWKARDHINIRYCYKTNISVLPRSEWLNKFHGRQTNKPTNEQTNRRTSPSRLRYSRPLHRLARWSTSWVLRERHTRHWDGGLEWQRCHPREEDSSASRSPAPSESRNQLLGE